MVKVKDGQTQTVAQLFAIGASILAEQKAKKTRAEVQKCNDDLFREYVTTRKVKTLEELSKAILADGQTDPKWKKEGTTHVGYQKAIAAGSVGAAGYNSFRSWCAKWYTEQLVKRTPEDLKEAKEEKSQAGAAVKEAAEQADFLTTCPTDVLIAELRKRADAGDADAAKMFD